MLPAVIPNPQQHPQQQPQQQQQQQQQLSLSAPADIPVSSGAVATLVDINDAAAFAQLQDFFVAAGLLPSSCRQRLVLALLSFGIGSEAALAAALNRDSAFLEQVAFHITIFSSIIINVFQAEFALKAPQIQSVLTHMAAQNSTTSPSSVRAVGSVRVLSSLGAQQRLSFGALAVDVNVAVPLDDEDDVAELVALLTRARLVPASSRRPIAAALCAAGIGSAEALSQIMERDAMFLTHQVPAVHFAA